MNMKIFGYKTGESANKRWLTLAVMVFLQWTGCFADYAGIYTGTFSGGDAGKWHMTVDSLGASKGFLYSNSDTNVYTSTGTVAANGSFGFDAIRSDSDFSGVIDGSGDVSGVWTNSYNEKSGGFTGQRVVFGTNSSSIVNSYYPMRIGQQWNYRGTGIAGSLSFNIKIVSSETVDGVSCLRANYSINSISRWYAQDADGAVWRLKGQDTSDDYFQMPSSPAMGDEFNLSSLRYRVLSTTASVVTPAGTFINCLELECLNHPLGLQEYNYYARGIGWVKSFNPQNGWELTSYSGSEADLIIPTVKITSPAANSRVSNSVCVVRGTATDNRAVTSVWVQVNGGAWTNAVGTTNWTSTIELAAGPNTISVACLDTANNESAHSNVFCTYVVAGSLTITTNGVGTVTRTPTNSIEIGQTYTLTATSGAGYGFTGWTGDATGTNPVVTVKATSNTAVTATFTDNVKPSVIITTPAVNARLSNAVCVVSGTAADDKVVASVWVQVNDGLWSPAAGTTSWTSTADLVAGPNTIRAYSMDAAGNYSAVSSVACAYVLDGSISITTNGVGTVTRAPATPVEIGQTYTLTATPGAGYGFVNWTGDVTGVSQVVTVKASSNTAVIANFADNVNPSVTITSPETNSRLSNAVCVVSGTASDDQSVTSVWVQVNGGTWTNVIGTTNWSSTVELAAGSNTIRVYSVDATGNHSATASVACTYVLAGSLTITTNGVGTVTRTPDTPVEIGQTYTLTAAPGVGYGLASWAGDVTGTNLVVTVNASSNTAVVANFTDNVNPDVTITTPAVNARLSNATCVVSGTATDNLDVVSVQIQLNSGPWTNAIGTTNWTSTVELVAGSNTIRVYSMDAASNHSATASVACAYVLEGSLTITTNGLGTVTRTPTNAVEIGQTYTLTATPGVGYGFVNWTGAVTSDNPVVTVTASSNTAVVANFADNVKPGVIITTPAVNARLSNAVCVVSGTATDDQAVTSVWVQVNGGPWTNAVGANNWTGTVDLVAGLNTIRVYSMDAASNRSVTASVDCTYVVAGSLTITTNGLGTVTRTPATPVEIGQIYTLTATSGAGYGFTGWAGDATGTDPVVTVTATSNTAVTATFTDNVKPAVSIATPVADARLSNAVCVVSGTASDDQSVTSVWVQVNGGAWTNAAGTTNWISTVELVAGPNTIRVYSMDAAGNYSAVSSVACAYVLDGSITITTNGVGTVTRTPATPVEIGQIYTLTATPGVGYGFVNWTGDVTGVSQVVTVKASSNTAVGVNFADNVKPAVTIISPETNSRLSNATCVVSGTATDNLDVVSVHIRVNGGTWTNVVGTTNWTSTVELVAGSNTLRVYSTDATGNNSATVSVTCAYVLEGSLTITTNGVGTVTRMPDTPVEIGQIYTLTATPGEGYGFVNWTGAVTNTNPVVTVTASSNTAVAANFADNVKPSVTIISPETNSRVSNATCVVSGMATDNLDVLSVQIQLNNGAWTNAIGTTNWTSTIDLAAGPNTISVYSQDAASNRSVTASVVCTYVVEASLTITTNGVGTVTRTPDTPVEIGQTYTLTATPGAGYGFVSWVEGPETNFSEVVNLLVTSNTTVVANFADNVKPAVTIISPETNSRLSNATCEVSGTASDDQSVTAVQIQVNGVAWTNAIGTTSWTGTVELVAGSNTVRVYSMDAAGNHSATASVACIYVLEGSLTITTNGVGTVTRTPDTPVEIGQIYTLTATPGAGYRFVNWTGAVTNTNPVVTVKASSNTAVIANFADNVKPEVMITSPETNSRLSNAVCVVSGTASDDQAVTSVWMRVNTGPWTNAIGTTNWTGTVELVAGPNTVRVYSMDAAGNHSATASVACAYVLEGNINITTNGVGTVTRTPDTPVEIGQTYTLTATPGAGYGFVNWTGAVTGVSRVVTVKATSNTTVAANFADNVKPAVTIISPETDSRLSNAVCVVSGTASDDQAVASVRVQVNGGTWTNAAGTNNWTSTIELVAGLNTIRVYSLDAASNRSATASVVCTYVVAGSLTITTNGLGTVTRTPDTPVEIGQTYTLTATPGNGYRFVNWTGDVTGVSQVVTVTATSNTVVAANFADNVKPAVTIIFAGN
jgi:uncharacterized repeat protein (TIGR02543 family)